MLNIRISVFPVMTRENPGIRPAFVPLFKLMGAVDGHGVAARDPVEHEDQHFADAVHEVHILVRACLIEERGVVGLVGEA